MHPPIIATCSCVHEFFDKFLGTGLRWHNNCKPDTKGVNYFRCTVCGNVIAKGGGK